MRRYTPVILAVIAYSIAVVIVTDGEASRWLEAAFWAITAMYWGAPTIRRLVERVERKENPSHDPPKEGYR